MSASGVTAIAPSSPITGTDGLVESGKAVAQTPLPPSGPQRVSSHRQRPPVVARPASPSTSLSKEAPVSLMPPPPVKSSLSSPSSSPSPSSSATPPASTERASASAPSHPDGPSQTHECLYSAHPPSKSATGGQFHSHRPVSAMPTPANRATQLDAHTNATGGATYADRRASAHPTVPVSSRSVTGLPEFPMSPLIDPAIASSAITSGIPITSPAALAYFVAHPRRQQVHFGSYLLLQTLGEGEFGRVKLGVHKDWGEEVAVKLIKRDKVGAKHGHLHLEGPLKDPAKISKVEREIQVLKDIRHPNIVRLYEVIESDRFIGIVLEYASGGELFDHILAHKYLKERDACRLFAQLISGVNYLHEKKIVHRDLKLENLLLDRNRNVIITDFGFANNFGERRDDLMSTSCGSPCYAAPELVVQDGLYAGSAVDVWSCGVILYAMLAGYLPFDDDPANPEGDNINLLYKYIMATPLSFPDYIAVEPRDLLSRMLVPDPQRRIDLEGVMAHSWLSPYRELFKFTVDELERAAIEQQTKKRQVYRQQMLLQQQMQEQHQQQKQLATMQTRLGLSHEHDGSTHTPAMSEVGIIPPQFARSASRSQRHTATSTPSTTTLVPSTSAKSAVTHAPGAPLQESTNFVQAVRDGRQADEASSARLAADNKTPAQRKAPVSSKTHRHTIQLEYEGEASQKPRTANQAQPSPARRKATKKISTPPMAPSGSNLGKPPNESEEAALLDERPSAAPALVPQAEALTKQTSLNPLLTSHDGSLNQQMQADKPAPETGKGRPTAAACVENKPKALSARAPSDPLPQPSSEVPFPLPSGRAVSTATSARRYTKFDRPSTEAGIPSASVPLALRGCERSASRHRKGTSTDKSFLSRLLSPTAASGTADQQSPVSIRNVDPPMAKAFHKSSSQSDPPQCSQGARGDFSSVGHEASGTRSGGARRKAMSLVVRRAPSGESDAAVLENEKTNGIQRQHAPSKDDKRFSERLRLSSLANQSSRSPTMTQSSTSGARSAAVSSDSVAHAQSQCRSTRQQPVHMDNDANLSLRTPASLRMHNDAFNVHSNDSSPTAGPSSGAAKKVMDWFRRKSLAKGHFSEQPPLPPLDVTSRRTGARGDAEGIAEERASSQKTPKVIVTPGDYSSGMVTCESGEPSTRSTSGVYNNISSSATEATGATSATELSGIKPAPSADDTPRRKPEIPDALATIAAPGAEAPVPTSLATPRASSNPLQRDYNEDAMRYHLGAVDQSALTSRPPPAVFAEVSQALYSMGIEARKERGEEFKLECVRRRKANQSLIGATQGLSLSIRTSVFPPTQAEYQRSALRAPKSAGMTMSMSHGAMSPSSSSIRNFLRRGSQLSPSMSSVVVPDVGESSIVSQAQLSQQPSLPPAIYGEPRVDGGQEVRFSVEITRIKNLPGLYSLDIRRLRGSLTSYKFLYHNVLLATDLSGKR